jgi:hypothetical protein
MRSSKAEFVAAITSGDADRVNDAIEEVREAETAERAHLFVSSVKEVVQHYHTDDGYQRLSVIRFLRQLYVPHVPAEYRDICWDLLCDAISDEDGRVRQAAEKAIDKIITFTAYREQPVEPLRADLAEIAETQVPTYSEIHSVLSTAEKYTLE